MLLRIVCSSMFGMLVYLEAITSLLHERLGRIVCCGHLGNHIMSRARSQLYWLNFSEKLRTYLTSDCTLKGFLLMQITYIPVKHAYNM